MGTIFGVDRDRYCRNMFEKADLRDLIIDPWQMWQRVSANTVACKFADHMLTPGTYSTNVAGGSARNILVD